MLLFSYSLLSDTDAVCPLLGAQCSRSPQGVSLVISPELSRTLVRVKVRLNLDSRQTATPQSVYSLQAHFLVTKM